MKNKIEIIEKSEFTVTMQEEGKSRLKIGKAQKRGYLHNFDSDVYYLFAFAKIPFGNSYRYCIVLLPEHIKSAYRISKSIAIPIELVNVDRERLFDLEKKKGGVLLDEFPDEYLPCYMLKEIACDSNVVRICRNEFPLDSSAKRVLRENRKRLLRKAKKLGYL